jgi:hypothetical protein
VRTPTGVTWPIKTTPTGEGTNQAVIADEPRHVNGVQGVRGGKGKNLSLVTFSQSMNGHRGCYHHAASAAP